MTIPKSIPDALARPGCRQAILDKLSHLHIFFPWHRWLLDANHPKRAFSMGQWLGPFSFYVFKYIDKCIGLFVWCNFLGLVFWRTFFPCISFGAMITKQHKSWLNFLHSESFLFPPACAYNLGLPTCIFDWAISFHLAIKLLSMCNLGWACQNCNPR